MKNMTMQQQRSAAPDPDTVATITHQHHAESSIHQYAAPSQVPQHESNHSLINSIPDGTLTISSEAAAGLIYMIEEEKMARDLYDVFASQTGNSIFETISNSEQQHYDTLLLAAQKTGVDITAISTTAGVFTNPEIQSLYNTLLAQGSVSLTAALEVGSIVEKTDMADIMDYMTDTSIGIIGTMYSHLETGSEHHLTAFTQQITLFA